MLCPAGMVSALLSCLVLSSAPSGVAELHQALEEQATLPAAPAHYPRAEMGRSDAVERVRELANEHAKSSTAKLKAEDHGGGNAYGAANGNNGNGNGNGNGLGKDDDSQNAAGNAAASAQGQARANQVRKNPGKPPKSNGPH